MQRPDVQDMIKRVRDYVDPEFNKLELQGASLQAMLVEQSILKIYMKDGRVISGRTEPAKGSPGNPMTYEEVADKLQGNAEFAKWPSQKAAAVMEFEKPRGHARHEPADGCPRELSHSGNANREIGVPGLSICALLG